MKKTILLCALAVWAWAAPASAGLLFDYGDPNAARLWRQLALLEKGASRATLRVVQLGDSHTGGDYFTQALRERLQQRFGSAGIGWLTPGHAKNHRSAQALMRMSGQWKMRISRAEPDRYPLGGMVNQAQPEAGIEIVPKMPLTGLLRVSIWSRKPSEAPVDGWTLTMPDGEVRAIGAPSGDDWEVSDVIGNASGANSVVLRASGNAPELGGIALDTLAPGVTVDALGIVGATQKVISKWQPEALKSQLAWRHPDLLILSYGTNEGFDSNLDVNAYRADLRSTIEQLRVAAPDAAILLIGAPNAGKKSGAGEDIGCKRDLPPALRSVQTIQRQVAQADKVLYWDWAGSMGGPCAMQEYAASTPPLARDDLVHFTEEGYARSGAALFKDLIDKYQEFNAAK
jgi:lysophospholipase L1-like esterase